MKHKRGEGMDISEKMRLLGEKTQFNGETAAAAGRKGQPKAVESRRKKKAAKDIIETFLSMPLKTGKAADIDSIKNFMELKGKNITVEEAMHLQIVQRALKGDLRAVEMILALMGEKPAEKVQVAAEVNNPFKDLTTEELRELINSE